MNTPQRTSYRFWFAALLIFSLLAAIQVTFLTIQNRELKQAISAPRSGSEAGPDGLQAGEQVQAFDALGDDGRPAKVSYNDADHLVLITSTKCQWCARTLPAWKEIAAQASGKDVRVIALSIDGEGELKTYEQANGLNFQVVNFPNQDVLSSYKAYSTPQTLYVKRGGKVERVWRGALSEEAKKEVVKVIS